MIDKNLEKNIKRTKDFIEIWDKFYAIFNKTVSGIRFDPAKESDFMSTRDLVSTKYQDLMDALGVKPLKRFVINKSMHNIFSLEKLNAMSDERLKAVENDWQDSRLFLQTTLERLKRKKQKIENFNKFVLLAKRKLKKK